LPLGSLAALLFCPFLPLCFFLWCFFLWCFFLGVV
jgi:hypothetical protein